MNTTGTQWVRWAFPPQIAAATSARRRLAGQLDRWRIGPSHAESILLIAYELVANAVEHARTPCELAVGFDGSAVVVEVHDESTQPPRLQPDDPHAARGRGLQLIAALARTWSSVPSGAGKTVRAVIVPGT